MTTNRETQAALLKAAFARFVELVEPIEGVAAASADEPLRPDMYTFVSSEDKDTLHAVFNAERTLDREYENELLIEFHTRFVNGRPLAGLVRGSDLVWLRKASIVEEAERGVAG